MGGSVRARMPGFRGGREGEIARIVSGLAALAALFLAPLAEASLTRATSQAAERPAGDEKCVWEAPFGQDAWLGSGREGAGLSTGNAEGLRMQPMKFVVTVDRDEDGVFVAECPAIPGCISQGATEKEALKNVEEAIRECLDVRAEKGMPLTVAVHQVEISV